jgi:hypothetical protein
LTDCGRLRERHAWIAVTAVLATALAWLATVNLVLLVNVYAGRFPEVLAVLRALRHAALALGRSGGPAIPAALVTAGLLLVLALRSGTRSERQARHA